MISLRDFIKIICFFALGIFIGVKAQGPNYEFVFLRNNTSQTQIPINGFSCYCSPYNKTWSGLSGSCNSTQNAIPARLSYTNLRQGSCCKTAGSNLGPTFKDNNGRVRNIFIASTNLCR